MSVHDPTFGAPTETQANRADEGRRCRKLWAAVVLAVLDDTITNQRRCGPEYAARILTNWVRSRDGQKVLSCAGIEPNERALAGLLAFVERGIPTSRAFSS